MATKDRTLLAFFKKKEPSTSQPATSSSPAGPSASAGRPKLNGHASTSSSAIATPPPSSSNSNSLSHISKKRTPVQIEVSSDPEPEEGEQEGHTPAQSERAHKKPRLSALVQDAAMTSDPAEPVKESLEAPTQPQKRRTSNKRPVIEDSDEDGDDDQPSTSPQPAKKRKPESTAKSGAKKAKGKGADDSDFAVDDDEEAGDASDDDFEDDDLDLGGVDWDAEESKANKSAAAAAGSSSAVKPKSISKLSASKPPPKRPALSAGLNSFERKKAEKKAKQDSEDIFEFLKNPRDADKNPVGHPDYDPRTLYIADSHYKSLSPFEKQFWDIKKNHMDVVLFFQKGKFYELYENDALIGHQEFDLKLTDRVKMKMVGVPEMQFDDWAHKFLARGYKVGRVDQSETALGAEMRKAKEAPKKKGKDDPSKKAGKDIVGRELKSVLTSATLVDGIVEDLSQHCVAIKEGQGATAAVPCFGICALDASTARFDIAWFADDISRTKLSTMLRQLRPKEVVTEKHNLTSETQRVLKNTLPLDCSMVSMKPGSEFLSGSDALEAFKSYSSGADGRLPQALEKLKDREEAMSALGGLVAYLKELNLDRDLCSTGNFNIFDLHRNGQSMQLDGQTLAHIEVLQNSLGETDATLFKLMNRCITPYGKRLFKLWLCQPLSDAAAINSRLDAVEDLMNNTTLTDAFSKATKGPDLERVLSRIHAGSCKPSQFSKVLSTLAAVSAFFASHADESKAFKSPALRQIFAKVPDLSEHLSAVQEMYEEDEGMLVPKDGADEEFDATGTAIDEVEDKLQSHLKDCKKELGTRDVRFKDIGTKDIYQIEVASDVKVPSKWMKMSGTQKITRYYNPTIIQLVKELKEHRETRTMLRTAFQGKLYKRFSEQYAVYLSVVKTAAEFDCLQSLAKTSMSLGEPGVRPDIVEGPASAFVDFKQLRHPCLLGANIDFIPNDVTLGGDKENLVLLTGPNMAGKSTLLRMTAAAVIMAQVGCYVPAEQARIAPFDKICTRMGANDFIFNNTSTFKVEMDDCKKIISEATPRSLVILDELGRGTSTFDGVAIAFAVLHHLTTHKSCVGFFSTHYNSLVKDFAYHSQVRACHMSTIDVNGSIVFSYTLKDGPTLKSYGPHVARLAGVPEDIVSRAMHVSENFERQSLQQEAAKRREQLNLPLPFQDDARFLIELSKSAQGLSDVGQLASTLQVIRCNATRLASAGA